MSAIQTMAGHLSALKGLLKRLEPDHIGRPTVEARIQEAEKALHELRRDAHA